MNGTKCSNNLCENQVGDGDFTFKTLLIEQGGGKPRSQVQFLLCNPCATALSKGMNAQVMASDLPVIPRPRNPEATEGTGF